MTGTKNCQFTGCSFTLAETELQACVAYQDCEIEFNSCTFDFLNQKANEYMILKPTKLVMQNCTVDTYRYAIVFSTHTEKTQVLLLGNTFSCGHYVMMAASSIGEYDITIANNVRYSPVYTVGFFGNWSNTEITVKDINNH